MRAARYAEHGGPEVIEIVDVPDPTPEAGDVVVSVMAASLNRLDAIQRNGWFTLDGFTLPHIAGMDIAGEVIAVGDAVSDVAVGDRVVVDPSMSGVSDDSALAGRGDLYGALGVIGATADGGYAEQCLAPASHVFAIPDGVSFEAAATFPTCFLTATHALFDRAALQPGETVMIHAAASGVSVAAIQLAKRRGATVLATAGSELKMERALELGADHVLNNRTGDVTGWAFEATQGRGVDLVFDHVGEALFAASLFSLSPRGRLVTCGNTSGDTATIASLGHLFHTGISIIGSDAYRPDEFAPAWSDFCAGVASGQYRVEVDDTYPLDGVADAQERLLAGDVVGKLVITPQV